MAEAARRIEEERFFGVDINFGCSQVSICRQDCGASILNHPELAAQIVSVVRKAVSIPLFVKYRIGWRNHAGVAVDVARRFEAAGADALTFHPRVAPDRRSRPPKWEYIGMVKQAVSIPVFGNGNVFTDSDCLKMMETTGCDGVAVGRMALARPWLFAEWTDGDLFEPDVYLKTPIHLAGLLQKHFDREQALRRFKRFCFYYAANFKFGHTFFTGINKVNTMRAAEAFVHQFFNRPAEVASRPNLNFFT
jgi:tRNA-dihydrouridine synthase